MILTEIANASALLVGGGVDAHVVLIFFHSVVIRAVGLLLGSALGYSHVHCAGQRGLCFHADDAVAFQGPKQCSNVEMYPKYSFLAMLFVAVS